MERGRRTALELIVTIPPASPTVDLEADAPTTLSNRSKANAPVGAALASGLTCKSPSSGAADNDPGPTVAWAATGKARLLPIE